MSKNFKAGQLNGTTHTRNSLAHAHGHLWPPNVDNQGIEPFPFWHQPYLLCLSICFELARLSAFCFFSVENKGVEPLTSRMQI
jgi:hypothetical protein